MCGLVGIFHSRGGQEVDRALLARMTDSLAHRGPDGDGLHVGPGIGLGHRRLAIIDLAGGAQPLFNEDGSVAVVFNGEIYNFGQLAAELKRAGHVFRTHSDTEVVVHAWEQWGEACVERFRGMFAIALWDARRETLFLARDRLGKKPLYYAPLADGRVLFGSELKALAVAPDLPREIDPRAVEDFFALGYIPDPKSIYAGVHKLPPAHLLTWRRGQTHAEPRRYWDVDFGDPLAIGPEEAVEELRARLRDCVAARMIADVPLGAFLSGGVDSSGVVATMARLSSDPVRTFSIGFGDAAYDESAHARAVAERYGTRHVMERVEPDAFDLVDRLAGIYDEPFADSSALPTLAVSEMARRGVTVVLSGDGGDEVLAGYRRYPWHVREETVRRMVPGGLRRPLFGALGRAYPKLDWAPRPLRAKSTLQELALDPAEAYFASVSTNSEALRRRLFSDGLRRQLQGYRAAEVVTGPMARARHWDPLSQIQYADLHSWLPGGILTKVDRASMAASLEVRVPMLDHGFVEWAARLPPHLRLRGGDGKHVLKKALEPLVPHEVLYRPKQGFRVPLAEWFRGPLRARVREALLSGQVAACGLFDPGVVRGLVDQHQSGRHDHTAALWGLLAFDAFLRNVHVRSGAGVSRAA